MAEAALSIILPAIFEKLTSSILKDLGLFKDRRKDIQKLKSNLSAIECVLADAEEKQWKDKAVKNWLKKLKDVACDVDDILDQCSIEATRRKLEGVLRKIRGFFSASNPLLSDLRMVHKIKEVTERLQNIADEQSNFRLREVVCTSKSKSREKTDSFVIESDVLGREEDTDKLVDLLLNSGNEKHVSVIPIVGMGGLGKTTLAKRVYNDARVKEHFHLKIWVCVSVEFDVAGLTKAILDNATGKKSNLEDVDTVQNRLREYLTGKKFLLVLDDVWEENQNNWDSLMGYLQAGNAGSKIIVTTRSEKMASMTRESPYQLERLKKDDCWSLFKKLAFGQGCPDNPNLINLGKEIAEKCDGNPLIAKAIGALMYGKTEESEWQSIKESEFLNVLERDDRTVNAMRLSYYHLSPQLKQCYAYCSVFPKDHWISKEELILMWVAQGIIQSPQASRQTEEEIGRECFNNLLWRSFFQDAEKNVFGNVVRCKMHDIVHDLAQSIWEDACSNFISENLIRSGCRHLSISFDSCKAVSTALNTSNKLQNLRTLLYQDEFVYSQYFKDEDSYLVDNLQEQSPDLMHNLLHSWPVAARRDLSIHLPLCLRVLDLGGAMLTKNTVNSISKLKQLRYLHLSYLVLIPESFIELQNLQTLRLTHCTDLKKLPKDMGRMTTLRHLNIKPSASLTHMPAKMGKLKYLQTLSVFVVGEHSGSNIQELQDLNLGGTLNIRNLEHVRGKVNAEEAKLSKKAELQRLRLSWKSDATIDTTDLSLCEQTLEGLQQHRNLRSLRVKNYAGGIWPHWISCSSLPRLVELFLIDCRGWKQEQLPLLNQFPLLKVLEISGMEAVKCIGEDFCGDNGFPSLEKLQLGWLKNLEEWSGSNGGGQLLPCLKQLSISHCPKLNCLPRNLKNLAALESLHIASCDKLGSLFTEESEEEKTHSCLQSLTIAGCEGLKSLDILGFPSLENLCVRSCDNLTSLVGGMHHPTAHPLEGLSTEGCSGLDSLKFLEIDCCDMTCLPERLRHATNLEGLSLYNLPNWVALPEWMGNLSNLRTLRIGHCPQVAQRYQRDTGKDWHQISHIPNLYIYPPPSPEPPQLASKTGCLSLLGPTSWIRRT